MKKSFYTLRCTVLAAVLFSSVVIPAVPALADLMILPIRVTFQNRDRVTDMTLINTSNEAATFTVKWLNQRQVETGGYVQQDTPLNPEFDLEKMIVFSPRNLSLGPNAKQRVRLAVRRPPDLPDGEYHAHLQMQRIGTPPRKTVEDKKGVSISLAVNVGFAVPVIVRQGEYDADATISNAEFVAGSADGKKQPALKITLDRIGKFSTNGRILIFWTPADGKEKQIGLLNGVNIYTEINKRIVSVPLTESQVASGFVRILYEGDGPDKGMTFDEKVIPVGG